MTDKPIQDSIAEDRAHYLAHPNDEDEWEDVPAPAEVTGKRPTGAMISVRVSAAEADEIRAAAERAKQPVSGFVRSIVLDRVREQGAVAQASFSTAIVPMSLGNFTRVVGQVDLLPGTPVSGQVPASLGVPCSQPL